MIFVAQTAGRFVIRPAGADLYDRRGELVAKGERGLSIALARSIAPDDVVAAAAKVFEYRDRPEGEPLARWVPWVDSRADQMARVLSDAEREEAEQYLLTTPGVVSIDDQEGQGG